MFAPYGKGGGRGLVATYLGPADRKIGIAARQKKKKVVGDTECANCCSSMRSRMREAPNADVCVLRREEKRGGQKSGVWSLYYWKTNFFIAFSVLASQPISTNLRFKKQLPFFSLHLVHVPFRNILLRSAFSPNLPVLLRWVRHQNGVPHLNIT